MTKTEKAVLKQAAIIITRELLAGRTLAIPGFGRFYTSRINVYEGQFPMAETGWHEHQLRPRLSPRFRGFKRLRAALTEVAMRGYRAKHESTRGGHDDGTSQP